MRLTLEHNGRRYHDCDPDQLLAAGVPPETVQAASLDAARAEGLEAIDVAAGRARGAVLTLSPGQEMIYARKLAEAQACQAAGGAATAAAYPLLSAEASARKRKLADMAAAVIAADAAAWTVLTGIETARITGKIAVRAATIAAAAQVAAADAVAALSQPQA